MNKENKKLLKKIVKDLKKQIKSRQERTKDNNDIEYWITVGMAIAMGTVESYILENKENE